MTDLLYGRVSPEGGSSTTSGLKYLDLRFGLTAKRIYASGNAETLGPQTYAVLLIAGLFVAYAARKSRASVIAPNEEALVSRARRSPASTSTDTASDEAVWAAQLPEYIRHWAAAEDADQVTPRTAARAIDVLLQEAGGSGFLVLYDLLNQEERFPIASACTLLRALGRTQYSIVRSYRGRLIRAALNHSSPAVRDAAALAIYDGRVREELTALREARDLETNPHVKRSMSEIIDAVS